jgi:glycine/D-amino acid oxidase-like deaminating enzyme
MDLHSHLPYWLIKNGIISTFPSLKKDEHTDIAIIGAGISGALAAYYLSDCGYKVTVIDRRHAGMGSTAASTALLQYEIDTPLSKLIKLVPKQDAIQAYKLCREAIYTIQEICRNIDTTAHFKVRTSFQYASYKKDTTIHKEEYLLRKKQGFDVTWLEPDDIADKYGFDAPGAILSKDGAEIDAYKLTHGLLNYAAANGTTVYDNTTIEHITCTKNGITLQTNTGCYIKAKYLIMAGGYESLQYIPKKVAEVHSTYALVSEPMDTETFWYKNSMIWETAMPYLYFRVTDKNRILVGGKDDAFYNPRLRSSRTKQKAEQLVETFTRKLPHIQITADFSWSGAFAVTKDGLPYIGTIPSLPNTYFALGFGGNGIVFSVIAATIIRDMIMGKKNADAGIFSFNR